MLFSQAKVKVLAEMWRRSGRDMVVYTGAGGHPARPWQMGAKMMVMYYLKRSKKAIQKIAKRYLKTQAHSTNQTIEHRWQLGKQLWELTRPKEVVDVCSGYMDIWQSNIYIYMYLFTYTRTWQKLLFWMVTAITARSNSRMYCLQAYPQPAALATMRRRQAAPLPHISSSAPQDAMALPRGLPGRAHEICFRNVPYIYPPVMAKAVILCQTGTW